MEPWFQVVLTIFSSVLASSGLWAYLQKKSEQKDVKTEMLIGLAHDRIMYLGMSYIDRGCVTQDEYENLRVYVYEPYERISMNPTNVWAGMVQQSELCRRWTNSRFINL